MSRFWRGMRITWTVAMFVVGAFGVLAWAIENPLLTFSVGALWIACEEAKELKGPKP